MEEKRRHPRVKANVVVIYQVKVPSLSGGSRIKNISESGICIPSKHYFKVDSLVDVEIRSDDLKEPITSLAKVVRVTNQNDAKFPFEVALMFMDLSPFKQRMLHEFIQRIIAEGGTGDVHWNG